MLPSNATLIALPTVKTQPGETGEGLVAIAVLTPERAAEILRQMKYVTRMASRWLGVYKVSSFDANTFYVPESSLQTRPARTDFCVLAADAVPDATTELVRYQIGIIPGAVIWEAFDAKNRFMVNTIELSSEILQAIANGASFKAGDTGEGLKVALPVEPVVDADPRWQEQLM